MIPLRINLKLDEMPMHWYKVVASYDKYFGGQQEDFDYPAAVLAESMKHLPEVG